VPVFLDESEGLSLIRLEGEVGIAHAAELMSLLLEALALGKGLAVNLQNATELDITAMQLLIATERGAAKSGIGFRLSGSVPGNISVAMVHAGIRKFPAL
jgi:anti-anti-sigma regulatory factor